ncbi:MAG: hypothetical protein KBC64_04375 [Simkaniaceae bacterium]|nr:hypothetical protein [Simkaniaceae bacterium]
MAAVAQRSFFDHIDRFAGEKTQDLFKPISEVGKWLQLCGVTQGVHPIAQGAAAVVAGLEVPKAVQNLHTLVTTVQTGAPVRKVVGDVASFGEAFTKAVKWALGFFKDAAIAPWTAAANAFGMYNCLDLGLKQVKDLTDECNKSSADQNACRKTHQVLDIAKFVVGFALNALSFAGVVAGLVISSPVMLVLSSTAVTCTFVAFFFKQEAANPRG